MQRLEWLKTKQREAIAKVRPVASDLRRRAIQRIARQRGSSLSKAAAVGFGAALFLGSLVTRLLLWIVPADLLHLRNGQVASALASCLQDCLLAAILFAAHMTMLRLARRWQMPVNLVFLLLYFALSVLAFANMLTLAGTGTVFDLGWLGHANPRDIGTAIPALLSVATPFRILVFLCILFVVPILTGVAAWLGLLRLRPLLIAAVAGVLVASVAGVMMPLESRTFQARTKSLNPVLFTVWRLVTAPAHVHALDGIGEALAPPDDSDWAVQPVRAPVNACCKGMNLLLITVDSVPLKRWSREVALANPARFPNLAYLYRRGTAFTDISANFTSSSQSLGTMVTSLYPASSLFRSNLEELADRAVATLPETLVGRGYAAAHFMSGQLEYSGADRFLDRRGFDPIEDSTTLRCRPGDDATMAYYAQLGDDCTAGAATAWLAIPKPRPFFLWVWLSNPHTPYFTGKGPSPGNDRSLQNYEASLEQADAAIGLLLNSLRANKFLDRTVIALVGDHGEAFGEHGLTMHGTSLNEEQVKVPLLIVAPPFAPVAANPVMGSLVDLAPTLLDLLGVAAPAGWQGRSLYAQDRPPRVYFISSHGGRKAGYREGMRKIILGEIDPAPYWYNLAKDPEERQRLPLSDQEARVAVSRVAAFVRYNNGLRWPARQTAPVTSIAGRGIR